MASPGGDQGARATPGRAGSGGARSRPGLSGRRIGVYEVLEELGRGGMGVVYRARDRSLDRDVAIKVLLPELACDEEFERRFVREARAAARLDHPNIVQVYTAGRFEDILFIAMQLIRGKTLAQVLRTRGRLPVREALKITRQAAAALAEAHKISLVHRDIKPNNIMIDEAGRVKIMDFGLMRSSLARESITQSGEFFGTPEYASPEQCETSVLDGRSDLYSLGAVLYEMLAGRRPYQADTPMALFKKILEEHPPSLRSLRPDVPASVEQLVRKMMAKRREDRFATAGEVIAAIDQILGRATRAVPVRPVRPRWVAPAAGGAFLLILILGILLWPSRREPAAPAPVPLPPRPSVTPVSRPERLRLVVFDLKNGIPQAETAWYEIALSDMLIASLSQQPYLEVPSRDMLLWKLEEMRLDGPASGVHRRVLTQELGAHAYLCGAYYVQTGKIRVTLSCYRLPENALAFPVRSFERSEKELFALVDEMALEIARGLQGVAAEVVAHLRTTEQVQSVRELALAFRGERAGGFEPERDEGADGRGTVKKDAGEPGAPDLKAGTREVARARIPQGPEGAEKRYGSRAAGEAERQVPEAPPTPPAAAPGTDRGKGPAMTLSAGVEAGGALRGENAKAQARKMPPEPRRRAGPVILDDEVLTRAWYQSRQELEKYRFDREQFETLVRILRTHFRGGGDRELSKGVESPREALDRVLKEASEKARVGNLSVAFVCPACQESHPTFGACPKCGQPLIFRVAVAGTGTEKKE